MDYPDSLNAGTAHTQPGRARRLAWCLWLIAAAQVVFALALALLNRLTFTRFLAEYVVAGVITTLALATVGLLIAARAASSASRSNGSLTPRACWWPRSWSRRRSTTQTSPKTTRC